MYSKDFDAVIDNGRDFDMRSFNCWYKTMNECEANCLKYHDCCNIAAANDILRNFDLYRYEQCGIKNQYHDCCNSTVANGILRNFDLYRYEQCSLKKHKY